MEEKEIIWLKFAYAWNWFSHHASQRLLAFNFYLIIMGAIGWIFFTNNLDTNYDKTIIVGIATSLCSGLFLILEKRNKQLVEFGKKALQELEEKEPFINTQCAIQKLDKLQQSYPLTHTFVIPFIYILGIILGLILFLSRYLNICKC